MNATRIFAKSCESMRELNDLSVSLTVTSPPYYRAINYESHARDQSRNYRDGSYATWADYRDYLAWMTRIFVGEMWRVTKSGGYCTVIIGTVLHQRRHYPIPSDLTTRMVDGGWEFQEDIIWYKCCAGVRRAGSAIKHRCPGYYYPNILTEHLLVFRKPGPPIRNGRTKKERFAARYEIDEVFLKDIANDLWHVAPVPPEHLPHPSPFPEELPYRLIGLYSFPGDLVLDPFAGSGQTLKVALALGRRGVGYEILPEYAVLARRRAMEPLSLREHQLVAEYKQVPLHSWPATHLGLRSDGTAVENRRQ